MSKPVEIIQGRVAFTPATEVVSTREKRLDVVLRDPRFVHGPEFGAARREAISSGLYEAKDFLASSIMDKAVETWEGNK